MKHKADIKHVTLKVFNDVVNIHNNISMSIYT